MEVCGDGRGIKKKKRDKVRNKVEKRKGKEEK